ncbi:MAG: amino acid permease [Chloroflexota bacterium]
MAGVASMAGLVEFARSAATTGGTLVYRYPDLIIIITFVGGSDMASDAVKGSRTPGSGAMSDEERLHELGYAQELLRRMGGFSNFAVSFTIISILSGCLTLYGYGMNTGGPVVMSIGWPLVGFFVIIVGLAMAEICSSFPTAGGLYYWSAKLADTNAPAWSWFTGWFNLLGQIAVTAGIDFGLAFFVTAYLNNVIGYGTDPKNVILIYAVVLILHGVLNTIGVRLVAFLNDVSVWWHILGVLIIVGTLFLVPSHHQSGTFVFTHFVNNTGWGSTLYVFLLGLLLAQYTFTGYDASAHMTEETRDAARTAPVAIVMSIVVSLVVGWILLLGVTFAIQNYNSEVGALVPPAQIFFDAVGKRGGLLLLLIVIGAQFFCGMSSVTANSRMIYAFSRDGALPGSSYWHQINKKTRTPTHAILLATVGAFILGLPYLFNATAYAAVTSIAVIGLYIAYVIPVFLRLRAGDRFERGPWHLGRWSTLVGIISLVWVAFITILFMLPTANPINRDNFNYTIVAVGAVLLFSTGYWVLSAHRWFTGPRVQGTPEELAAIERELAAPGATTTRPATAE